MKTVLLTALVCLGVVAISKADPVLTFDDWPGNQVALPAGYHGLNWTNFVCLDATTYGLNPSGYQAGIVSDNNIIYGVGGETASISAGMFDLLSAYATAAWNDNLQMVARGYIKGTVVYQQTNTLSATSPTLITFNFYGVDTVEFTASGGTKHSGYSLGAGTEMVLDNVSVKTYVPYVAPFITNGGFETGDFSGWNLFGSTNDMLITTSASYVHSGTYGVEAGPTSTAYLSQIIEPVQIGVLYTVSCWLDDPGGVTPNTFGLSWAGEPPFGEGFPFVGVTNLPAVGWTNIAINLIATRPSEYLEFQFLDTPSFLGFDDVSVTPAVLVSNGGFETGDFSGWASSGNTAGDFVTPASSARRAGSYGAGFGSTGSPGFISQTVTTSPGQFYLLSVWLDSPDGEVPNQFEASLGSQTVFNQSNLGAFGWTNLHFTVVNSSTQATLQFGLWDDPSELGLDEISLIPVPILQNGGFEFGDFTGWTTSGNFEDSGVSTNSTYAEAGFYGAQMGPVGSQGFISQTFATVPGQPYMIGLMLDNPTIMTNSEFSVLWNGGTLMDVNDLSLIGWLPYNFMVTATNTTSTLKIGVRDDPSYLGLDQVSVSPVMPPIFQSIARSNNLVNLSWNVWPGYEYELQYCTNLVQQKWTAIGTAAFPSAIPMTATDTNFLNENRFYRVTMYPPPLLF